MGDESRETREMQICIFRLLAYSISQLCGMHFCIVQHSVSSKVVGLQQLTVAEPCYSLEPNLCSLPRFGDDLVCKKHVAP